jgi:hypothetical protein
VEDVPLILAGSLALIGAAVHGAGGEVLVVRKLSPETLPPSAFGGPRMTKAMIHASWHMTTVAFLTAGVSLLLAGTVLDGDEAKAVALVAAAAFTGFALIAVAAGAGHAHPRSLIRHPGPIMLAATAVLAWLGALGA